ncbi:MAG: hypothetical protein JWO52_8204 [Gammaproteobacteria bacterium]|jgi:hypothetical protein|nr:hypothetical protein [Gammaproteobacteria bacterium]
MQMRALGKTGLRRSLTASRDMVENLTSFPC